MAGSVAYNANMTNIDYIYSTTSGGTVFSANQATNTVFDYFSNSAVVNDAIYFGRSSTTSWSDLTVNIGTAIAGTGITGVWEYWCTITTGFPVAGWRAMHDLDDGTAGFTLTGAKRVVFPLQARGYPITVNGSGTISWIRYRLTAVGTITEGGANSTSRAQYSVGLVYINNYTDASPCTWKIVYDWIVANAPQIGATQISNDTFKFNSANFQINSTLKSNGEHIFMGNGTYGTGFGIAYLWSGTKVGANGWTTPTDYYFCWSSPSSQLSSSTTTRVYGGRWDYFTNIVDGLTIAPSGLLGMAFGEWIGVYQKISGYFNSATCDRCTVDGGLVTAGYVTNYPTNLQIANPLGNIWSDYGNSFNVTGITYSMPSSIIINMGAQYTPQGQTINITNPNPSFPNQTDTVKVMGRNLGTLANLTSCLFYDSTTTTYTDYTAASANATVDDVPISGNVGDILYLKPSNIIDTANQCAFTFTMSSQSNDYVYAIEHYKSGAWYTLPSDVLFDLTNNFTQTGVMYLGTGNPISTVTVNGTLGYWFRIRIVTQGTGSPTLTKIQSRMQGGIGNWRINEKYTYDLNVTDTTGAPIQNALVYITDKDGNPLPTLTTDSKDNAHTLTDSGNPTTTTGKFGSGTYLNSFQSGFKIQDAADLKPIGNFSISAWVNTTLTTSQYIFQSYSQNTNYAGIQLSILATGKLYFLSAKNTGSVNNTDYKALTGNTSVKDGNWHHIVGTWDGSNLRLYVDGTSDATAVAWANAPAYATTNYVRIGCYNNSGGDGNFLFGSLDDLAIFNGTALSLAQVQALYVNELNTQSALLALATAYYRFEPENLFTNSNGAITQQILIKKYTYFDKNTSESYYNGSDYSLNPYTVTITKPGYETYTEKISISSVSSKSITMKPSKSYGYVI